MTSVEALTNILVGLKRHLRGEHHAATRAIVVDAADQVCRVMMAGVQSDPYNSWRRMEAVASGKAAKMKNILAQPQLANIARGLIMQLGEHARLPEPLLAQIDDHLGQCDAC